MILLAAIAGSECSVTFDPLIETRHRWTIIDRLGPTIWQKLLIFEAGNKNILNDITSGDWHTIYQGKAEAQVGDVLICSQNQPQTPTLMPSCSVDKFRSIGHPYTNNLSDRLWCQSLGDLGLTVERQRVQMPAKWLHQYDILSQRRWLVDEARD